MSSIFGAIASNAVTLDTDQSVSGKKRFLNVDNEFDGTMNQPTILALGQTIDPTELSFLAGVSSNIQTQFAGINIVLTGLTALEQALQAIEPAPNETTAQFNNTISLVDSVSVGIANLTNEHLEIVGAGTENEIASFGFSPGETTNPKMYLATHNEKTCIVTGNAVSLLDTGMPSEMRLDIYGCQKTGSGNDFIIRNEEPLGIGAQKQFLRLQCGQSLKSDPSVNPDTGEHWIERDEHVKIFDTLNGGDSNKAFRFHDAISYVNQDAKGGFSVLLSNCSSDPCRVEPNDDGTLFYCKNIGGEQPEFYIHEWDTTRVTLVILSDGSFRWAVSMYR